MYEWGTRHFADKQVLFNEGDHADGAYQVESGSVRIYRTSNGHVTEIGTIKPGEMFGEMSLVDDKPRSASAAAIGDVSVRFINKAEFNDRVPDPLIRTMFKNLAARLRSMDDAFQRLEQKETAKREVVYSFSESKSWFV